MHSVSGRNLSLWYKCKGRSLFRAKGTLNGGSSNYCLAVTSSNLRHSSIFLLRNIWLVCYLRILSATQTLTGVWAFPHGGFLLKKDISCEENSHGSEGAEVIFNCRNKIHNAQVSLFEEITFKDKAQLLWLCDKQSHKGGLKERHLHNWGMGREKLFSWKDNSGKRTNMYKLAVREFKTGETILLQKACNSQSSKLLEQAPKQEW